MANTVEKLHIISSENNIFDTDKNYVIPLYQRAFAWEETHLTRLIEDISDIPDGGKYYLGSLIVSTQGHTYEVIDGQQRLTALYLLLHCLGENVKHTLTFACRARSNKTLAHLQELLQGKLNNLDAEDIEPSIQQGLRILSDELRNENKKAVLKEKLKQVILYRIEVPENTDLNRYFEIMNTRGEQLEQHDILKATLMGYLKDPDQAVFAQIWDACSDMTGYVQMHFASKNNTVRAHLFGNTWNQMPPGKWDDLKSAFPADTSGASQNDTGSTLSDTSDDLKNDTGSTIADIIDVDFKTTVDDGFADDEDGRVRFESVIDFPFFLLHTLKVLIAMKEIRHKEESTPIIADLLDDKKLVDSFDDVIKNGVYDAEAISDNKDNKERFSKDFAICLLKTRFLFDQYIIKREYINDTSDGEWSLKSLEVSNEKPYYKNTMFSTKREHHQNDKNPKRVKDNLMIQSALRVSYTSPKGMHWITRLLIWLSKKENFDRLADYHNEIETIAKEATKNSFLNMSEDERYHMGVDTPHIVFNYLDYLLWKSDPTQYNDFVFEFRNSVEHWYPQHPSEGFDTRKDDVDRFGNLCILQRNINSRFSNLPPEAKKINFRDRIAKGSIKLRMMSDMTTKNDDWIETAYKEHEKEMIEILQNACNYRCDGSSG